MGTLRPGTPGPADQTPPMHYLKNSTRKSASHLEREGFLSHKRAPFERNGNGGAAAAATCHKCGEQFVKREALESHHLSKHAGRIKF